jgi:hypothetical protein
MGMKKLQNEELNGPYWSPNIVRVIKSNIMRWAGHIARMGEERSIQGFRWGNLGERDDLEDPGVGRRIKLKWIFRKWKVREWTG